MMSSVELLRSKQQPFAVRDNLIDNVNIESKQKSVGQPVPVCTSRYASVFLNSVTGKPGHTEQLKKQVSQSLLSERSHQSRLVRKKVVSTSQLQKSIAHGGFFPLSSSASKSTVDDDEDEDSLLVNLDTTNLKKEYDVSSSRPATKMYAHMVKKSPPPPAKFVDIELENELKNLDCDLERGINRKARDEAIEKAMKYAEILKNSKPKVSEPPPPPPPPVVQSSQKSDESDMEAEEEDLFGVTAGQEEVERKRMNACANVAKSDSDVIELEERRSCSSKLNSCVSSGDSSSESNTSPESFGRARKMSRKRSVQFDYEAVEENVELDAEIDTARFEEETFVYFH
jgi:hypothetical protein